MITIGGDSQQALGADSPVSGLIRSRVGEPLKRNVEGVEKVILGYIPLRQRRCNWNAHPSTEVISTRWHDTNRTMLTKSL